MGSGQGTALPETKSDIFHHVARRGEKAGSRQYGFAALLRLAFEASVTTPVEPTLCFTPHCEGNVPATRHGQRLPANLRIVARGQRPVL